MLSSFDSPFPFSSAALSTAAPSSPFVSAASGASAVLVAAAAAFEVQP